MLSRCSGDSGFSRPEGGGTTSHHSPQKASLGTKGRCSLGEQPQHSEGPGPETWGHRARPLILRGLRQKASPRASSRGRWLLLTCPHRRETAMRTSVGPTAFTFPPRGGSPAGGRRGVTGPLISDVHAVPAMWTENAERGVSRVTLLLSLAELRGGHRATGWHCQQQKHGARRGVAHKDMVWGGRHVGFYKTGSGFTWNICLCRVPYWYWFKKKNN